MAVNRRLRFEVLKRDGFRCQYCGLESREGAGLVVDHVIPVALGGADDANNLVACCRECNSGKSSTKLPDATVERVTAAAVEHAEAISMDAARRKQDWEQRGGIVESFRKSWDAWTYPNAHGQERTYTLPPNYRQTIVKLAARGLGPFDFEELVEVAMLSQATDRFRYFAGRCWKRLDQIEERIAPKGSSEEEEEPPHYNSIKWDESWSYERIEMDLIDQYEEFKRVRPGNEPRFVCRCSSPTDGHCGHPICMAITAEVWKMQLSEYYTTGV